MFWHPIDTPEHGHQFRLDYDICRQAKELRIIKNEGGRRYRAEITFVEIEQGSSFPATLSVRDSVREEDIFQNLFDALWWSGYRPPAKMNNDEVIAVKDEVIATKDEVIAAKDAHVSDLRSAIQERRCYDGPRETRDG